LIRPNEAPGLTAALARSAAQRAADLATLIADDYYRAELARRGQLPAARAAATHLVDAALSLEGIANALAEAAAIAEPAAPHCGHCGAAVTDPNNHTCEARA
jgi:hypothetical protein